MIVVTLLAMFSLMATSKADGGGSSSGGTATTGRRARSGSTIGSGTVVERPRTSARGSSQRYGVGDPVRLGRMTVLVDSVEDRYVPVNRRPADGRYVAMDIVVTNNGELPEALSLRDCFELQDRTGWASELVPATRSENGLLDGIIDGGGGQRAGRVYADVPVDVYAPELHFTCDLFADGNAIVRIEG